MLKKYRICDGKLIENGDGEASVFVYIAPDETEKKYLIDILHLDEHTLNSSLDPEEVSRVEFEVDHEATIIKRPRRYRTDDNFLFKISSVGLFLFKDKLIMILAEEEALFEGRQFTRIRSLTDVFLKVIHRCIIHFEQHLNVIQQISNELEQEINKAMANRHLVHMFSIEKSLVYYLKAISSNGKVIERLKANAAKFCFTPDDGEFLEDVIIENSQCYEEANIYSQVVSGMMDAWVSIVSNNLNILIKNLTIVMICIMVPNLILSFFSMNVKLPFPQGDSLLPFWSITVAAFFSIFGVVILYKNKHFK